MDEQKHAPARIAKPMLVLYGLFGLFPLLFGLALLPAKLFNVPLTGAGLSLIGIGVLALISLLGLWQSRTWGLYLANAYLLLSLIVSIQAFFSVIGGHVIPLGTTIITVLFLGYFNSRRENFT